MANEMTDWEDILNLRKPEITGQFILRDSVKDEDGRRIMMVVGVIAVPEGSELKSEHQYTVTGSDSVLNILPDSKDVKEDIAGMRADQILCRLPLWRV